MHPVFLRLGFVEVYSYGLMVALGFLVSTFLLSRRVHLIGLDRDFIWNFSFCVRLGGIIGGRLLYVLLNLNFFVARPQELFMVWHGGLVWYGGFLGGFLSGIFYLRKSGIALSQFLDLAAPYAALGQAIGRVGCFLNGCCYGKASGAGLFFPVHNECLLPTQIYSSLSLIIIFMILRIMQERPHRPGLVFVLYVLLYSVKRFLIEFLRNDSARIYFGFTIFQVISLAILIVALYLAIRILTRPSPA